jgi:hypothetical protein
MEKIIKSLLGKKEKYDCISIQTETECSVPLGRCHIVIGKDLRDKQSELELTLTKFHRCRNYLYCTEKQRKELRSNGDRDFESLRIKFDLQVVNGEVVGARSAFNLLMDKIKEMNKIKEKPRAVIYPKRNNSERENWHRYAASLAPWFSEDECKFLVSHKPIRVKSKGIVLKDSLYDDAKKFVKCDEFIEKLGKMKSYRDQLMKERGQESVLVYLKSGDIVLFPKYKIQRTKEL